MGLGPESTTPPAQARLAVLAALVPYTQVNDALAQLGLGLALDIKSTECVAQRIGARVKAAPPRAFGTTTRSVTLALDGIMLSIWEGYEETRCAEELTPSRPKH